MKSRMFWGLALGVIVAGLLVAGSVSQENSNQVANTAATMQPKADAEQAAIPASPVATAAVPDEESSLTNAPVQPISTGRTLPPNLKLTEPALEVVRLAESGVEESVLLAFVTNSTNPFNLGADEIIYLNDIGVPGPVVAAMIQRDRTLKELAAGGSPAPAEPAPAALTNQYAPEALPGGPYAPQPADAVAGTEAVPPPAYQEDYGAVNYAPPAAVAVTYSTFYDSLAPYGTWLDVGGWGPCWRPTVAIAYPGWQPYCHGGRWIYSDCGWYWLSGYSWGWAPFHYGRWFRHSHWGWCWRPDSIWGPAWVGWRYGGNYCGWAPLPPAAGFGLGIGLTYHGRPARPDCGFGLGAGSYTFVNTRHFHERHLHRHAMPHHEATRAFNETRPSSRITDRNSRVVNHGIPASQVASATRTELRPVAIRPMTSREGGSGRGERFESDGRALAVYRPRFPSTAGGPPASGAQVRPASPVAGSAAAFAPATQRFGSAASTPADAGSVRPEPRAAQSRSTSLPGVVLGPASASSPKPPLAESLRSSPRSMSSRNVVTEPGPRQQAVAPSPAPTATRSSPEPATVSPERSAPFTPAIPITRPEITRPSGASSRGTLSTVHQTSPRPGTGFPARTEPSSRPTITQPAAPAIETPRSRPASPARGSVARPTVSARPQPLTTPSVSVPSRTEPARSALRPTEPPTRIEPQRQTVVRSLPTPTPMSRPTPAPTFSVPRSAPTPTPTPAPSIRIQTPAPARSAPAPAVMPTPRAAAPSFSPAPARSISPPAASSAPRLQAVQARPTPSASPAPATSSPGGGQGRPSSGPRGR